MNIGPPLIMTDHGPVDLQTHRLDTLQQKVDALTAQVEALTALVATLAHDRGKTVEDSSSEASATPVVNFTGPIVAACDRLHVDEVLEDDETYVDLSKRGPKN